MTLFRSSLYLFITSIVLIKVLAQTPSDFQPGTNVRLGVSFPGQSISPAGTVVKSIEEVRSAPDVKIPASALQQANNGSNSFASTLPTRFAVFMIDIDVIANGTATTLLHWFESDLIPQGQVQAQLPGNVTRVQSSPEVNSASQRVGHVLLRRAISMSPSSPDENSGSEASRPRLEAPYLPPSPPPGNPHRYVLALFVQMANYSFPSCYSDIASPMNAVPTKNGTMVTIDVKARLGFDVQDFAKAAGLIPVPVAGNFFKAGTDIGNAKKRNIWEKRATQPTTKSVSLRKVDCAATATATSKESPIATTVFVTSTAIATTTKTVGKETILVTASSSKAQVSGITTVVIQATTKASKTGQKTV